MKTRLTKDQKKQLIERLDDPALPLEIRRSINDEIMYEAMNPVDNFDPTTFDIKKGVVGYDARKRNRVKPPSRLPTMGMLPKEILQGQMVGMYESKQDLYLIMAHFINDLLDRIEVLEGKGTKGPV